MAVLKDLNVSQIVLGIETSCDETAVACVHSDRTILAQTIHSQLDEHAAFGGVVPEIAARAHLQRLRPLLEKTLADAAIRPEGLSTFGHSPAASRVAHRAGRPCRTARLES